jgi:hypothetical protein
VSLRRSPQLTPASLAARRANARKSTGPRTEHGKARVALNPLKLGRYAIELPERLARAGYPGGAARWHEIRSRIAQTFEPALTVAEPEGSELTEYRDQGNPAHHSGKRSPKQDPGNPKHESEKGIPKRYEKRMDRLANWVWCSHRGWQQPVGAKLESLSESGEKVTRLSQPSMNWSAPRIRVHNPWARLGLVFYSQRRRGWFLGQLAGRIRGLDVPDAGCEMEAGLRSRVYRLGRPRFWERIRYCLDREGYYHPEWRGPYRKWRRELANSSEAVWLEPHPILAALQQQQEAQAGGRRSSAEASE